VLQAWHSLSDPEPENSLRVRIDFMLFTGFDMPEVIPDETTLCRFRNKLIAKGLDRIVFSGINRQLEAKGWKVKNAQGAVIDATVISFNLLMALNKAQALG
jgi:transposase, IS5 family